MKATTEALRETFEFSQHPITVLIPMKSSDQLDSLTREELYEQVWQEPADTLAKRFGISNVGLGKLYRRLNIPVPPRGYWAKLRSGKKVPDKPPLPDHRKESAVSPVLTARPKLSTRAQRVKELPQEVLDFIHSNLAQPDSSRVPQVLRNPDPIVLFLKEQLEDGYVDERYGVVRGTTKWIHVRVSKGNVSRALRILDALLTWFRARQLLDVHVLNEASIRIYGRQIRLGIEEQTTRLSPEEAEATKKRSGKHWGAWQLYKPTGDLVFKLVGVWGSVARKTWRDRLARPLESLVPQIIENILIAGVEERLRELDRQRDAAKWENKARDEIEERRRLRVETAFRKQLERQASQWKTAKQIRQFADEVMVEAKLYYKDKGLPEHIVEWETWARRWIAEMNPLSVGADRFFAQVVEGREAIGAEARSAAEDALREYTKGW